MKRTGVIEMGDRLAQGNGWEGMLQYTSIRMPFKMKGQE